MKTPDFTDRPLVDLLGLDGRIALVTGGGRGYGRSIAIRLAEAGGVVAVTDLDLDLSSAVRDEIEAAGGKAIAVSHDVREQSQWEAALDQVESDLGVVEILVNNAGIYPQDFGLETPIERFDQVIDINLRGSFLGSKLAAERMVSAGKRGVLLAVSSTAGERLVHGEGLHYAPSKAGVSMLVRMLGVELKGMGIRSVGIAPGLGETPGVFEAAAGHAEERLAEATASSPLGRLVVPDDVGRVAAFLVSDLAAMVNAEVVIVDAGRKT